MSQGQGVRLGGGEQGSHQVLFVNHPQPLLDAVWRRGGAAGRGGVGQGFRWNELCALVTDPRSGVRLSGQALPGSCRAGDEVKMVLVLAQW